MATAPEQQDWGIAGEVQAVQRTLRITMTDNMRFSPDRIEVKEGETVKLVLHNAGKMLHEMVIGTKKEIEAHAEQMKKHPNMAHDAPWMAHVDPGKTATLLWRFNRAGEFRYACLLPGHYEAGMVGQIVVHGASLASKPSATEASTKPGAAGGLSSAPTQAAPALERWSQGEVKRIDLAARKITLKHGPIAVLGMDPMTMVFQLRDEAVLQAAQSLKAGDQIEFEAAYDKGAYLVVQIRPVQPTAGAQSPR
jgi:uncharacterized cupredoxin-like copper-binding protein/Cu/Ag efflux protein CusF